MKGMMMSYTFEHSIRFKAGDKTRSYRATRSWKTVRGALKAAQQHAAAMDAYYAEGSIALHAIVVVDEHGKFVTNMAA